ncbi:MULTISPECIES: hypothetical protein [unclassified Streptomyces]|uniref:hypothetical protein n=1 Tax=unclassified Streptomyces TaxID=2593676 RepID=UPI0023662694|nr:MULTISPECIES: hypothetical protein [unclassified Streptomyces]MDF3139967.1 hypothetical protein [Streptomyces sp. T21Q-yed]WDF39893.1 hypothetical protein PBV52_25405 [Streptomyces sp. T12]
MSVSCTSKRVTAVRLFAGLGLAASAAFGGAATSVQGTGAGWDSAPASTLAGAGWDSEASTVTLAQGAGWDSVVAGASTDGAAWD